MSVVSKCQVEGQEQLSPLNWFNPSSSQQGMKRETTHPFKKIAQTSEATGHVT